MKKIILDCDPGMDDSIAIVMAAKAPGLELLAITTVHGNYPVDITSKNALKMLELLERTDIPVARGMEKPLVRANPKDPFTHGIDGQADNFLPEPSATLSPMHAVDLIIHKVLENPKEVHLLVTGPMTNIAMAMLKEPAIVENIASIIAISGAFGFNEYAFLNATGDSPQSEWNVYVDPEAAKIVYQSGVPLVALGLDVATHFDVNFTEEEIVSFSVNKRLEAKFLAQAIRFVQKRGFEAYCTIIDCLAVAYAIDSTLVEVCTGHVGIETTSDLTLGMTVLDRRHHHQWTQLPVITIGKTANHKKVLELISHLVLMDPKEK